MEKKELNITHRDYTYFQTFNVEPWDKLSIIFDSPQYRCFIKYEDINNDNVDVPYGIFMDKQIFIDYLKKKIDKGAQMTNILCSAVREQNEIQTIKWFLQSTNKSIMQKRSSLYDIMDAEKVWMMFIEKRNLKLNKDMDIYITHIKSKEAPTDQFFRDLIDADTNFANSNVLTFLDELQTFKISLLTETVVRIKSYFESIIHSKKQSIEEVIELKKSLCTVLGDLKIYDQEATDIIQNFLKNGVKCPSDLQYFSKDELKKMGLTTIEAGKILNRVY
jgi:hypothetical protein